MDTEDDELGSDLRAVGEPALRKQRLLIADSEVRDNAPRAPVARPARR